MFCEDVMNNSQEDIDRLFCFNEYQNGFNQGIEKRLSDLDATVDKLNAKVTALHVIILVLAFIIVYQLL